MFKLLATAAIFAGLAAAPAAAVTYDAFTTFNGTQGAGNFIYGSVDDAITAGSLFAANTNCAIAGSVCLQAAPNTNVPGAYKSTTTSFQYGSVNVPDDRLLLHPGATAADGGVFITFVTPFSGIYNFSGAFSVQDISPTGVSVIFRQQSGANPASLFAGATLNAGNTSYSYSSSTFLNAGDVLSVVINRDGNYGNDSTGVNFAVSQVPEPASWALLIAGFGMVGVAARRRRGASLAA